MKSTSDNVWPVYSPSSLIGDSLECHYANKLINHYCSSLKTNAEVFKYVTRDLGFNDLDTLSKFRLGFCDRTFPKTLPATRTLEGEMPRGYYERLGLVNGITGHERYRGMVFVPIFDEAGVLIGSYGQRKAVFPLAKRGDTCWSVHPNVDGLFFNHQALTLFDHIVLCETPFDVISLDMGRVKNAISLLDFQYFDDEHLCQLIGHDIKAITIAFSHTPIGDRYFFHIRNKLQSIDIKVDKLSLFVGESINSTWAKSQRFKLVQQVLMSQQT